ncbi:hypothetical protein [Haladaptatus halobius]|uniref:hypothetical protein n=1 Tax=Haladaptatus halobius TaxID=2884875 RepID=UPI001D0B61E1|nr:hypothetical protein [Haladaptatus halobius]
MKQLFEQGSQYENYLVGSMADYVRANWRQLFKAALLIVAALLGLVWVGTLLSYAPTVVMMIMVFALLTTLPVVISYIAVQAVTVVLRRQQ